MCNMYTWITHTHTHTNTHTHTELLTSALDTFHDDGDVPGDVEVDASDGQQLFLVHNEAGGWTAPGAVIRVVLAHSRPTDFCNIAISTTTTRRDCHRNSTGCGGGGGGGSGEIYRNTSMGHSRWFWWGVGGGGGDRNTFVGQSRWWWWWDRNTSVGHSRWL